MSRLKNFRGVIPALITTFDEKGDFDPLRQKKVIDWLLTMNIGGFYITGSTGQGPMMDITERMTAVEHICEAVNGRTPVAAHIADVSAKNSIRLAVHAQKAGCIAVSAVPSYYYKLTTEEMYRYYSDIAGATDLPLIIYAQTQNYTPCVALYKKLSEIKNIEGLKYTGADHYTMGRIKEALGEDFMIYSGCDEMFVSGILSGADAIIGSTYNVIPDLYAQAVRHLNAGDIEAVKKELLTANAIVEVMLSYELNAAIRTSFEFMGIDAGHCPSPLRDMTSEEKKRFKNELLALKNTRNIETIALFEAI